MQNSVAHSVLPAWPTTQRSTTFCFWFALWLRQPGRRAALRGCQANRPGEKSGLVLEAVSTFYMKRGCNQSSEHIAYGSKKGMVILSYKRMPCRSKRSVEFVGMEIAHLIGV